MMRAIERAKGDSLIPRNSLRVGRGQFKSGDLHPGSPVLEQWLCQIEKSKKLGKCITSPPSRLTMCIFLKPVQSTFEYTWDSRISKLEKAYPVRRRATESIILRLTGFLIL